MATWLEDICTALESLGGIAHKRDIVEEVIRIRHGQIPRTVNDVIQNTIQTHSSDAKTFKNGKDLFYSIEGVEKKAGFWGLRSKLSATPRAVDILGTEPPDRVLTEIYRILRDTELARRIKALHKNKCQLCTISIRLSTGACYSEVHHVRPLGAGHDGPDVAENIMVVCPNCHVLLDYGAVRLHPVQIRQIDGHFISPVHIEYHNKFVCGSEASATKAV